MSIRRDAFLPFDDQPQQGRFALSIEYLGSAYHGWQTQQAGIASVQDHLEAALSKIARVPIQVTCSGRTDTGVHASSQIVHFDSPVPRSEKAWVFGTNTALPADIRVRWAKQVPADFHARYCAIARRYRYVIYNHKVKPALLHDQMTWWPKPLDVDKMHQAAQALVGEHDFSSFRAAGCQSKTPWRKLHFIRVWQAGDLIVIDVQANAFLHHMIRNIAGVLLKIGVDEAPVTWTQTLLQIRDRTQSGMTAPPHGLHFVASLYAPEYDFPCEPLGPHYLTLLGDQGIDAPYPALDPSWQRPQTRAATSAAS